MSGKKKGAVGPGKRPALSLLSKKKNHKKSTFAARNAAAKEGTELNLQRRGYKPKKTAGFQSRKEKDLTRQNKIYN